MIGFWIIIENENFTIISLQFGSTHSVPESVPISVPYLAWAPISIRKPFEQCA